MGSRILYLIIKSTSQSVEEKRNREFDKIFDRNKSELQKKRLRKGLKLPICQYKTFPILIFVEQRKSADALDQYGEESQIGRSEKIFYKFLRSYFGEDNISWNRKQIRFKRPDFIFEDKINSVHIVIEIDEPYIALIGTPIHYFENYEDSVKEKIYKDCGWTLIRFSESQVFKYPKECCKFIAQVIDYSLGEIKYSNLPDLKKTNDVPKDNHWDFNEAKNMSLRNSRF